MALTECKECGSTVSKSAKAFPGCGAKQGVGTCGCLVAIIIFPFLLIIMMSIIGGGSSSSPSSSGTTSDYLIKNSSIDGSVFHVKEYLKKTLKDPKSYEGIEWSNVQDLNNGTYSVRHKYRAKNSFGGYVIENQIFIYDASGNIISSTSIGN